MQKALRYMYTWSKISETVFHEVARPQSGYTGKLEVSGVTLG